MTVPTWIVTGASGFIGRHLIAAARQQGKHVRALTRDAMRRSEDGSGVEWIVGDLSDPAVWSELLVADAIVINLAYAQATATAAAVEATRAMMRACAAAGVRRVVHCSTVSVFGRTAVDCIDETTPCVPLDDYGRQKLAVEQALLEAGSGAVEVAILRPAAVFGAGGEALKSLVASLSGGGRVANYLRASLFGRRRMHLVPVETVVVALAFLAETNQPIDREVFIVAEDDDPQNNFRDVERALARAMRLPDHLLPLLPLPSGVLAALLRLRSRSDITPYCRYSAAKLRAMGFVSPVAFGDALALHAARLATGSAS